jgi:hypothetical protein
MLSPNSDTVAACEKTYCSQDRLEHKPSLSGAMPEYLTPSQRVLLVTATTVGAARGVTAEEVGRMVDDFTHPKHIRFAFNLSIGWTMREFRFWREELLAPAMVRNFTIQDVIARILGGRTAFRRSEWELAVQVSSKQMTRLIRLNVLKCEHGRFPRAALETFLFARWSGNNPN